MIRIAYSGSLDSYNPYQRKSTLKWVKDYFWTFKNDQVDRSTRSAYYLIKAIKLLKIEHGITPNQLNFDFWGLIDPLNIEQAKNEGVSEFFTFGKYVDKASSIERLQQADLLFLPLEKSNSKEHKTLFIPGKLYEYLMTGKPILALVEDSDCKNILIQSGSGLCVEPDNPQKIADLLFEIIKNEKKILEIKLNQEYINTFSFKNKTSQLAKVLNELSVK